jgi:hypothetical protein
MHPETTVGDPADTLDQAANGLGEAIAFDFASVPVAPVPPLAVLSLWHRWLLSTRVAARPVNAMTMGMAGRSTVS